MPDPAASPQREQGWLGPVIGLLLLSVVPLVPVLRVLVPIERTVYLLVPALAVCSLVGWWAGGRWVLAVIWILLAAWTLTAPDLDAGLHFDRLQRGWALLLAACFGGVSLVVPERGFLTRALATITLSLTLAAVVIVAADGSGAEITAAVTSEFAARNQEFSDAFDTLLRENESWRKFVAENTLFATLAKEAPAKLQEMAVRTGAVFPALLALQSLAVLALAWSLFHRLSRTRIGVPIGPLRDFRFDDKLIWGLLLGLTLLLPQGRTGFNDVGWILVVFFGGLYALRGLAVTAWVLRPRSRWLTALAVFVMLALPQFVLAALVGLGVGDTWVDWRRRPRPSS